MQETNRKTPIDMALTAIYLCGKGSETESDHMLRGYLRGEVPMCIAIAYKLADLTEIPMGFWIKTTKEYNKMQKGAANG